MTSTISAIVIAKNEEDMIKDCLESLVWAREIVFVDTGSKDKTVQIAKKYKAKVYKTNQGSYSDWRNFGASRAKKDWLLYVDADERVTPQLREEINTVLSRPSLHSSYAIPRRNILLGHEMRHGGWWPDYVLRLVKKSEFIEYRGDLHEQPVIKGESGKLENPFVHISHRSLKAMLEKTNKWSVVEAKLLHDSNHPRMNIFRFVSVAVREFWYRTIKEKGFLDGTYGWIEIIYQVFSKLVTYTKLWEMQLRKQK